MKFELDRTLEILEQTPATLNSLLAGLSRDWTQQKDGPEGWSPFDIVGHLLHGEENDWIPRLKIILEQGQERPFTPFDRFAQFEKYRDKQLDELLAEFKAARECSLQTVEALDLGPEQLELKGSHPELGTVTIKQLLATWAVHDLSHIAQTARAMAKGYTAEVGPWKKYLSVLTR